MFTKVVQGGQVLSVKQVSNFTKGTEWIATVCKTGKYVNKGIQSGQVLSVKQVSMFTKEY